jgi:hypothetical protein
LLLSEKRQVPTFKVYLNGEEGAFEGPVVSPTKDEVALDMRKLHDILHTHNALLVYARRWVYVPIHTVHRVERGASRFSIPWPLVDE